MPPAAETSAPRPVVGISSCLLGEAVRYDGGHKRDDFLAGPLSEHVTWMRVCPEVELGLGVPRPPLRLEREDGTIHLRAIESRSDLSGRMAQFAASRLATLAAVPLSGYVLKARSPSCGARGVPVYAPDGTPVGQGAGRFAALLLETFPHLPVAEEASLECPRGREAFVAAAFARARWHGVEAAEDLVRFHGRHALLLASRDPVARRTLDAVVEQGAGIQGTAEARAGYEEQFFRAMRRVPARNDHARVLSEITGHLDARAEAAAGVAAYGEGRIALSMALGRLRDVARRAGARDLLDAAYFAPHPPALGLLDAL
ncbi:MAG: DUF523 and DUF1722 domain-containing protein [Planctomycetota bacterium]|jgi:uncharacterized protein YbbK (DUF523 family)/uncharacterized protein YbgA (DUF1722 family)